MKQYSWCDSWFYHNLTFRYPQFTELDRVRLLCRIESYDAEAVLMTMHWTMIANVYSLSESHAAPLGRMS